MMTNKIDNVLNVNYWNDKYESKKMGWDIGYVSTPIKHYIDQLSGQEFDILIPGAGNSYEAEYLLNNGFKKVHVLDFSPYPLNSFRQRVPTFNENHLHQDDFFFFKGQFDLIIEQTFLSAILPSRRMAYVEKLFALLRPNGKVVGVIFNKNFNQAFPPFGGNLEEYRMMFAPFFNINVMETAYNSIPERSDSEFFINLTRRPNS